MSETIGTTLDVSVPSVAALSGELALRIRGGDYHGRIVRIRASQCTVGSAPDCTLRLSGPGVRPLHCIILRNDVGATVRRWSPDTQLNGRAFSDALLMPGDKLGIGPIELEVLDDSEVTQHRRGEIGASPLPVAELAGEIVSHLRRDLRGGQDDRQRKVERQQLRKSRRRIKSLEAELERLQAAVDSLTAAEGPAVSTQQPDAWQAQQQADRAAWDSERRALIRQLDEKEQLAQRLKVEAIQLREECQAAAARQQTMQDHAAELVQLKAHCADCERRSESAQHAESLANANVRELQERIAVLEAAANPNSQDETSEALESAQQQVHELFAECERLRDELHQANCSLAAAQCRLSEQEAALTAFREMHQHAIAELDLECKTLQTQLADAQTKFDEQCGRLAEFESQQISIPIADNHERITELEAQLASAVAAKDELQMAAEQNGAQWSQREQELTQRIECLERLAGGLEDELRNATSNPDKLQLADEQRQRAEQQLSEAQRQWSEQRQLLEDQALTAHQQLQDMENQVASMRDALHSAHGQVRERDQLLSQLRDEVRGQLALWQQERGQLLQQLQVAQDHGQTDSHVSPRVLEQKADFAVSEPIESAECQSVENYCDRPTQAERYGAEVNEAPVDSHCVAESPLPVEAADTCRPQNELGAEQSSPLSPASDQVAETEEPRDVEAPTSSDRWEESSSSMGHEPILGGDAPDTPTEEGQSDDRGDGLEASAMRSSQPRPTAASGDDEESIEAYMARLLKRVRGDAVANAFVVQQAAVETAPAKAVTDVVEQAAEQAYPAEVESQEFLPRKAAPEQAVDVAAMRELAVESTRHAINQSSQLRFQRKSLATTLGACALMGLSVGLFGWGFDTGNWLAWSGSGVFLLGAVYLMTSRLKLRRAAKAP